MPNTIKNNRDAQAKKRAQSERYLTIIVIIVIGNESYSFCFVCLNFELKQLFFVYFMVKVIFASAWTVSFKADTLKEL